MKKVEHTPTPLPIKEDARDFSNYAKTIRALFAKHIISVMNGKSKAIDIELEILVGRIYEEGYNKGVAKMDQLHSIIDNS